MSIKPKDFEVSVSTLGERLHISETSITPFGYEKNLDDLVLGILKTKYDAGSLFLRTRPDFFVLNDTELYFVEAKQRTLNVEAIQLLYNKQLERMGVKVLYSFPDVAIRATQIPMELVVIPENYCKSFDTNLKHLFEVEGIENFRYVNHVNDGSGDAFVPIDVDDLKILSEDDKN